MDDVQFLSAVLFFISSITAGCVIQWGVSKIRVYKPPVSILWFLFGIVICLLELLVIPRTSYPAANGHDEVEIDVSPHSALGLISIGIAEASRMPHNALYYVVLPILLYDATQLVHWHHFKKNIKTGVMLAVSGIVLQVFVLGALMQWSFSKEPTSSSSAVAAPNRMMVMSIPDAIDLPDFGANLTNWEMPPFNLANRFLGEDEDLLGEEAAEESDPSFASYCMIAAAVGATDPIAVLGVLESLDAPAHLVSLFDSESLINDGTAIFMFTFFKSMSRDGGVSWGEAIKEFFLLLLGVPLVGLVCAAVLYRCIKHFRFHPFDITLLVVAVSYLVFFVAEIYLKTSAPLAIVVYGLYFKAYAKAAFEAETSNVHHTFVRGLATAMTSLVFIISGIACMRITWDTLTGAQNLEVPTSYPKFVESAGMPTTAFASVAVEAVGAVPWKRVLLGTAAHGRRKLAEIASTTAIRDLWHVPVFYLFCNLARAFMILVLSPLINKDLGSFSWKEAVLLWWGGLRGGVCLILALLIEQDEDIPDGLASKAALYCASAVFLILVINGTTFEFLFRWLKPYKANPFKEIYLLKVLKFIDEEFEHEANLLQSHWLYQNTNILEYSSRLVPVLGDSEMHDMKGLQIPPIHVRKVMQSFDISKLITPCELGGAQAVFPEAPEDQVVSSMTLVTSMNGSSVAPGHSNSPESPDAGLLVATNEEQTRSITAPAQAGVRDVELNGDEVGHQAAAKIQNLQNIRHEVDVLKTVEKLHLVPESDSEHNEKRQARTARSPREQAAASPLRKIKSAHQPSSPIDGGIESQTSYDDLDITSRQKLRNQATFDQFTLNRGGSSLDRWSPEIAKSSQRTNPRPLAPLEEEEVYETIRSSLPSDSGGGSPIAEGTSTLECLPAKMSEEKRVRWSSMKPDEESDSVSVSPQAPISARRHPLYKTGGYVYRIRSEPYSTNLDAANLERLPMRQASPPTRLDGAFPESTGIMGGESDWASYFLNPEYIPRTMSVPDNVGGPYKYPKKGRPSAADGPRTAKRISDHKDGSSQRRDPHASVRPWHREGEVVMMVVNSMRHLYRRMYEQNFISGTCLVFFMGNNDVINDYAIAEETPEKGKQYFRLLEQMTLLDICIDGRLSTDYTRSSNPLKTQQHTLQHAAALRCATAKAKAVSRGTARRRSTFFTFRRDNSLIQKTMENVTPFDLEWYLLVCRLRLTHRWNVSFIRQLGRRCVCHQMPGDGGSQTSHTPYETPPSPPLGSGDGSVCSGAEEEHQAPKTTWRDRWQRLLVWVWALVGPRQIFPALDDLQTLCAYVDVHEEMLVRGDRGLRFILGAKLLESYSSRTARGKAAVRHLIHFYPQSLPYALICHGAVFLINLKIQLVEEYHERGLLMTSDCEAILGVLKRQIIRVTKHHPQYLFT